DANLIYYPNTNSMLLRKVGFRPADLFHELWHIWQDVIDPSIYSTGDDERVGYVITRTFDYFASSLQTFEDGLASALGATDIHPTRLWFDFGQGGPHATT